MCPKAELFNRKTKTAYTHFGGGVLAKKSFFSEHRVVEPTEPSEKLCDPNENIPEEMVRFLSVLEEKIPASNPNREQLLNQARFIFREKGPEFLELIEDRPELIEEIKEKFTQAHSVKKDDYSLMGGFLKPLASTVLFSHVGAFLGIGTFLTQMGAVAAQNLFKVHGGTPDGGSNLCHELSGYLKDCIDGYITEDGKSWEAGGIQYRTLIEQADSKYADLGAYLQLDHCVDEHTIGDKIAELLPRATSNTTVSCSASSSTWLGFEMSSKATGIPEDLCTELQSEMTAAMEECMKDSGRWKWDGIISGSIIGGVVVLALVGFAAWYAYEATDHCDPCRSKCCP